jgi:hypothetical protein
MKDHGRSRISAMISWIASCVNMGNNILFSKNIMETIEIPGLGILHKDSENDSYCSEPRHIAALGDEMCFISIEDYDEDPCQQDFHVAIQNFLSIDQSVIRAAEPYIYQYYQDCNNCFDPTDDEFIVIEASEDIWEHIELGGEAVISRRFGGDKNIYVSLSCYCDWEEEHGLQIVFKNGLTVNRIGSCTGHLTNSDAYGNTKLEDVIYRSTSC